MNPRVLRQQTLERDNFICQTCLQTFPEEELEVHHIIPKRLQGIDSLNNTTTICNTCHNLIELYRAKLSTILRCDKVIRVDEDIHKLVKMMPRTGMQTDGDIIRHIVLDYVRRNKIEIDDRNPNVRITMDRR